MHTTYFFTLPWDLAKKRRPSEPLFTAHDAGRTPPKPRTLLYSVHYGHLPRKSQLCCAQRSFVVQLRNNIIQLAQRVSSHNMRLAKYFGTAGSEDDGAPTWTTTSTASESRRRLAA